MTSLLDRPALYIPSRFEREWGEYIANGNEDGCSFIRSNTHRVKSWLTTLQVQALLELHENLPDYFGA